MPSINHIFEQYLSEGGTANAAAFAIWLIKNEPEISVAGSIDAKTERPEAFPADAMTAILVGRLERFVHVEAKQALRKVGITNPDEFGLMATLHFMGKTTKTQLLKQCIFEITTGSQMLKRLKQEGYIVDEANPADARSSLINLSESGRRKVFEAFEQLNNVNNLTEGLTDMQRNVLLSFLHRLDHTHSTRQRLRTMKQVMEG